jgi:hypothetical protein
MATNTPGTATTSELIVARDAWRFALAREEAAAAERLNRAYGRFLAAIAEPRQRFLRDYTRLGENGERVLVEDIRQLSTFNRMVLAIEAELRDFDMIIRAQAVDVTETAIEAGAAAARQMTLASAGQLAGEVGQVFMRPDPAAIKRLVDYADSPAFRQRYDAFGSYHAEFVRDSILSLTAQGKNSRAISAFLEGWTNMPRSQAENQVRTMQAYASRRAAHASYAANREIVSEWMWYAALDARTCPSCISKHGQRYGHDAILNDHHRGRCTPVPVVRGARWPDTVITGPDWFATLTDEEQRQIMGPGRLDALNRGEIAWGDMSQVYRDPIYGEMQRVRPLRGGSRGGGAPGAPGAPGGGGGPFRPDGGEILTTKGYRTDDSAAFTEIRDMRGLTDYLFEAGNSPRVQHMMETGALTLDETAQFVLDRPTFNEYMKRYVKQSQSSFESRDRLVSIVQDLLRDEHNVRVSAEVAERALNQDEAIRADALLKLADVGGHRLTTAQRRRLERARDGEYLDMVFERTGDAGTFENARERARERSSGIRRDSAEYRRLKDDWDRQMGVGQYMDEQTARILRKDRERRGNL